MPPVNVSMDGESRSALPVEIELKLSLPAAQAKQLWKNAPLSVLVVDKPSRQRLFSAYYDTPCLNLYQRGVGLRLRRQGKRWVQTLKTRGDPGGGLQRRTELEVAAPGGVLDQHWLKQAGFAEFAKDGIPVNTLGIVFTTEFNRDVAVIEPVNGTHVEVCVDQGAIVAGSRHAPICEVELELKKGELGPLFEIAQQLAAIPDVRIETASKAQRGYRMVRREQPAPVKASSATLPSEADVDTVFKILAFACIDHVQANEHGVLRSRNIEYVHQARVALRRLRSVFSVFSEAVPNSHFGEHLPWLHETSHVLGEARDWDVFVSEFLPEASSGIKDHAALPDLTRQAARLRAGARRRICAVLAGSEYTIHMLRLTQLLHEQNWDAERKIEQREISRLPPKTFAASMLDHAHRKVIKQGKRLDRSNYSDFHQLRIRIKKLRYSAELLSPLFGKKGTRRFLSRLTVLQKILGDMNDAANAATLVDRLALRNGEPMYAQVIAYLRGYAAAQARFSLSGFNTAWKRFFAAKPFW